MLRNQLAMLPAKRPVELPQGQPHRIAPCRGVRREILNFTYDGALPSLSPRSDQSLLVQILLGIMSGAFGLAGYYFGRKPTSATSEADISVANSSMPWQIDDHDHEDDSKHFKYRYHPRGDKNETPKNAPSALNTVIIPNVTLPKVGCNV
jgi:hypothetical protein